MEDKRYLIFISSTFEDLKEEREKVLRAVLKLNHFPVGMEQFPAVGIPPMDLIKQILKDCDYYILIIGARYGSINKLSGISYTEEEYNYARSLGIPVIAFFPSNPGSFPVSKLDEDNSKRQKLEEFKAKVKEEGGITISYWNNADHLQSLVLASIPDNIKYQPRTGWVRADAKGSGIEKEEFEKLKQEIGSLSTDNSKLRKKVAVLEETNKRAKEEKIRLEEELLNLKANSAEVTASSADDQGNGETNYWGEIYRVNTRVNYTYDLLNNSFNYKVDYSLKDWFRMIGIIIKNYGSSISQYRIANGLGDIIFEDTNYSNLFYDRAGKLVQSKKSPKIARLIYETDLKITSVSIDSDSINEIIKRLIDKDYLTIEYSSYIKLTEMGEDFLLQHCL